MRGTLLYREAESLCQALRKPGTGHISDAAEIDVAPDGKHAVFAGALLDKLDGPAVTRICQVDFSSGEVRVLTFGPNTDRSPRYSPDGRRLAFLSDRRKSGDFQLYLLDVAGGAAQATTPVDGWVEFLHWSPDGKRLLLGVAGHGADMAGRQGGITRTSSDKRRPSWMPRVETGDAGSRWRHLWMYELGSERVHEIKTTERNVWEAAWCGNEAVVAVASNGPGEGLWYGARLHLIDIESGRSREIYAPEYQLGWPAASPSGDYVAIVEAISSDRSSVAGDLLFIDTRSGNVQRVDTHGVDVTCVEWCDERRVLVAGHRGFATVVGLHNMSSAVFTERWASPEISTFEYIKVSPIGARGDCALIGEGFMRAPEIASIRDGQYRCVKSFDLGYAEQAKAMRSVEQVTWNAPDGLQIQGWLLLPDRVGPHPVVMQIHGGPVSHWRPMWLGRSRSMPLLMLLQQGYAVFLPNPRGSSGRGQDFARHVLGEIGGADTHDYLSGIDHLVERRIADPHRLGVTGISYGGYMTAWLITQDSRFAAAVAVSPVTNHVTEQLLSNIPHFVSLFLQDRFDRPGGKYFERSPIMYAHKAKTPTLNICGALDRCTPPEEALQFHNSLLESGVKSVLVTYPEEGHGVRMLPAAIDYAARVVDWFQEHMP